MAQEWVQKSDEVGLCASCKHVRIVRSERGTTFYLCNLAEADSRFEKYPRLPVLRCPGYERESSGPNSGRLDSR